MAISWILAIVFVLSEPWNISLMRPKRKNRPRKTSMNVNLFLGGWLILDKGGSTLFVQLIFSAFRFRLFAACTPPLAAG